MYFTHSYFKTLRNKAVQEYIENKKKQTFISILALTQHQDRENKRNNDSDSDRSDNAGASAVFYLL